MSKLIPTISLLLFTLLPISAVSEIYSATVIHIWDGDSLVIQAKEGPQQLRIKDIDAPEKNQPFANESKNHLNALLLNQQVTIESHGEDKYHRILAYITLEKTDVGETMVKNGLAWAYRYYNPPKKLIKMEQQAKNNRLGIWQQSNPTPPWLWRKQKK